jgi:hypothetical protein
LLRRRYYAAKLQTANFNLDTCANGRYSNARLTETEKKIIPARFHFDNTF